jgi:SAM-dependent methyltransferase
MVSPHSDPPRLPPLRVRLPHRHGGPEILDGDPVPIAELARSLAAMAQVNRRLGGVGPVLRELRCLGPSRLTLLDVGTGNGAFPRALARRLETSGIRLEWAGMDLRAPVLEVAQRLPPTAGGGGGRGSPLRSASVLPRLLQGDARALPFPPGAFDVVLASLTLHHLDGEEVVPVLREMGRVARRRVLVSELERHPLHYAGARLLAWTVWRKDRITRVDAPLSVLKGFTRPELLSLAGATGLLHPRVKRAFPFRLLLSAEPG